MKILATAGAGLLIAAGTIAAMPAEAQRWGYDRYDRGYNRGYDRGYDRGWRGDRGWNRGRHYGWNRGGWNRGGWDGYRRGRVVCRIERGWYGPERVCFRR